MPYDNLISRGDAAALIPEEVSSRMLADLQNESGVLGGFSRVPVGRNQVRFPVLSALPVAYFVNGDTGLKQTSEVNWDNKYMNVEELAVIVPVPENVLDDVAYDIWGEVEPLIRDAMARTLDSAVFFGVNAPGTWPTNVSAAALAAGNTVTRGTATAANGGVATDLSNLLATLEADGYDPDRAIARTTIKGVLRNARDTTGVRNQEVDQNQAWGSSIAYPMRGLWPTASGSPEFISFDSTRFLVGIRSDISFKRLDQAVIQDNTGAIVYNLPQQDMVATRCTFRVAWQVSNPINYDEPDEADRYPAARMVSP
ncbi:MAG: phage major capsid protein [Chloroflexi bacterium]|nr:MAG: phage major capsid protein [Chloroflexota bacterium]